MTMISLFLVKEIITAFMLHDIFKMIIMHQILMYSDDMMIRYLMDSNQNCNLTGGI